MKDIQSAINSLEITLIRYGNEVLIEDVFSAKTIKKSIKALKKQKPVKPKIWENSRYEDGEPIDNIICGNCEVLFIGNIDWEDLSDDEKIKKIVSNTDIDDFSYCPNCGQKIDWEDIH